MNGYYSYIGIHTCACLCSILQPSLDGNTKTAIIVCATPSSRFVEDTRSSLKFAGRAKRIKTKVSVNAVITDAMRVKKLEGEIKKLRRLSSGGVSDVSDDQWKQLKVIHFIICTFESVGLVNMSLL
jgi:hypothetical protein